MIIIFCPLSYLQLFTVKAYYTCSMLSNLSVKNNTKMININGLGTDQPPGHLLGMPGLLSI